MLTQLRKTCLPGAHQPVVTRDRRQVFPDMSASQSAAAENRNSKSEIGPAAQARHTTTNKPDNVATWRVHGGLDFTSRLQSSGSVKVLVLGGRWT